MRHICKQRSHPKLAKPFARYVSRAGALPHVLAPPSHVMEHVAFKAPITLGWAFPDIGLTAPEPKAVSAQAPTPLRRAWTFSDFLKALKERRVSFVVLQEEMRTAVAYLTDDSERVFTLPANHDVASDLIKYDIPFELDTRKPMSTSTIMEAMGMFFQFLFLGFLLRMIILSFSGGGGGGGANGVFGMAKSRAKKKVESDVTFKDVAGMDVIRKEVEEIVDFMKNPEKYKKLGAKLPKGVLLSGSPGTGKTLLAKAIANEAGVPLYACAGSEFVEMFVGVGAARIRDLFEEARKNTPCIIFIDEIDSIGRKRSSSSTSNANTEQENAMNQLLTEMDGFGDSSQIVVIGATNRTDILDDALMRRGRFDRQIEVALPTQIGREAIFGVHTTNKPVAKDIALSELAKWTAQFSGADIEYMCNEAAIFAARKNLSEVTRECFEYAFEKVALGLENEEVAMSDYKRRVLAYHEAGHTLMGLLMNDFDAFTKVSIIPRGAAGGVTYFSPSEDIGLHSQQYLLNKIMVTLGGRIAEELTFGKLNTTTGASGDLEQVFVTAKQMVSYFGFNETLGPAQWSEDYGISGETSSAVDGEIRFCVEWCYRKAREIMETHESYLKKIAEELIERNSLNAVEILDIISGLACDVKKKTIYLNTWEEAVRQATGAQADSEGEGEGDGDTEAEDAEDAEYAAKPLPAHPIDCEDDG